MGDDSFLVGLGAPFLDAREGMLGANCAGIESRGEASSREGASGTESLGGGGGAAIYSVDDARGICVEHRVVRVKADCAKC